MNSAYENILRSLECPVCTNYMIPPIKQCVTGHSFCGCCHDQLSSMEGSKCPVCQEKLTQSRNITLESIAETASYPCQNKEAGCTKTLPCQEMNKHQNECFFREVKCGLDNCRKLLNLKDVESHWISKKLTSKPFQVNNICHTKINGQTTFFCNLVKAHNSIFWYKCKVVNNHIYFVTQYIGPRFKAQNFYYEVELFKADRPKRRLVLSDYCKAPDMDHKLLFTQENCINLDVEALNQFAGKDGILIYYMRVFPVDAAEAKKGQPGPRLVPKRANKDKSDKSDKSDKPADSTEKKGQPNKGKKAQAGKSED